MSFELASQFHRIGILLRGPRARFDPQQGALGLANDGLQDRSFARECLLTHLQNFARGRRRQRPLVCWPVCRLPLALCLVRIFCEIV